MTTAMCPANEIALHLKAKLVTAKLDLHASKATGVETVLSRSMAGAGVSTARLMFNLAIFFVT